MPTSIYLDNNATTRPFLKVVEAISQHLRESFANPGSRHIEGRRARRALEAARESIAATLGANPAEVVFTSGGTEATNLALLGLTPALLPLSPAGGPAFLPPLARGGQGGSAPSAPLHEQTAPAADQAVVADPRSAPRDPPRPPLTKGGSKAPLILLTRGEHPATLEACRHLERHGWRLHFLDVDAYGRLRDEQYDALSWDEVKLATVILAHNETGVIQDLAQLIERCNAAGVPTHVDAVQAVGKIPVSFRGLGATALSFGAHKFHGPRGVGGLLVRRGVRLNPLHFGGHQESDRRPGTEPVPLIAGLATALALWDRDRDGRALRMTAARDRLEAGLTAACPPVVIHGKNSPRLPNTASVAFPGLDGEALLVALDLDGVACSLGSTCASGSAEPAPVLLAMGVPPAVALATVRFGVSFETTPEEIDDAVRRIAAVVNRLRTIPGPDRRDTGCPTPGGYDTTGPVDSHVP